MTYTLTNLGKICEFKYGNSLQEARRSGGNVPVFGSNGVVGWHDKAVSNGPTIVIGRKGSIGEIHFSEVSCWPIDTTYYVDRTKVSTDLTWLFFMLSAMDLPRLNKSAAVPGLNRNDAYEQKIPLPPLAEQQRIADILSRADRLRRLRRFALEMSGGYLQAVFLEMFGDPVTNPMGWEVVKLNKLCEKVVDCPHSTPTYAGHPLLYPCIRSSDIQNGYLDWSTTKYVSRDEYITRTARHVPAASDVVYCREGARFGNAARIPTGVNLCLGQRMMLFRVDPKKCTSEFLWGLLESKHIYSQAAKLSGGSASPHVNVGDIKLFTVVLPPIDLQNRYTIVVSNYERLRAQQREALRQAEHLFQGLLQAAFRGEV